MRMERVIEFPPRKFELWQKVKSDKYDITEWIIIWYEIHQMRDWWVSWQYKVYSEDEEWNQYEDWFDNGLYDLPPTP